MAQSWHPYSSVTIPLLPGFPLPVGNWWFEEVWGYHGSGAVVSLCLMMGADDGDDAVVSPPTCGYVPTGHLRGLARC